MRLAPWAGIPLTAQAALLRCLAAGTEGAAVNVAAQDWGELLRLAYLHGLSPRLATQRLAAPDAAPAWALAELATCAAASARQAEASRLELGELAAAFAAAGMALLATNGPVVQHLAHGGQPLQAAANLDLLVAPADRGNAAAILAAHGYAARESAAGRWQAAYFLADDGGRVVDLQWDVAPRGFGPPLGLAQLIGAASPLPMGTTAVLAPAAEDLLQILALKGARDRWARLAVVADVAGLLRAHPAMDLTGARAAARARGLARILDLALYLAHELADAPLPAGIRQQIVADPAVVTLAGQCRAWLFRDAAATPGWVYRVFTLRARERLRDGLRYLLTRRPAGDLSAADAAAPGYVPTPSEVVARMLELAEVGPGDALYDLGCGDGRVLVAAVGRGARAVGIDRDPALVAAARASLAAAGTGKGARVLHGDLLELDLRPASVITLYLSAQLNLALRPRLRSLAPGTRVISVYHDMGDWPPTFTALVPAEGRVLPVYAWHV